jgi:hypothetical protein
MYCTCSFRIMPSHYRTSIPGHILKSKDGCCRGEAADPDENRHNPTCGLSTLVSFFQVAPCRASIGDIWALNVPGPRLVNIHHNVPIGKFYTTTPSPANLLVFRESRLEMSNEWALCFGTRCHSPLIWVNLQIDTVRLD